MVKIDVHLTPEGVFAVFHDWTLDCQTDGTGVTHATPWAVLQGLDIGFGHTTPDSSHPLRDKGVGLMPRLKEVLAQPADTPYLLINFKSRRAEEGTALAALLAQDPDARAKVWGVYGGGPPARAALAGTQDLRGFDRKDALSCLSRYVFWGGAGTSRPPATTRLYPSR